jgi:hypothetical protein
MGEIRNAYKILFENPKGRGHLGDRFCSMESVFISTAIMNKKVNVLFKKGKKSVQKICVHLFGVFQVWTVILH